ncbi:MAG: hypothetical protein KGI97_03740 [Alphaproteobacteria bacterium]|nr:hypothetical protein [Alphaproteobacteria bacterium]
MQKKISYFRAAKTAGIFGKRIMNTQKFFDIGNSAFNGIVPSAVAGAYVTTGPAFCPTLPPLRLYAPLRFSCRALFGRGQSVTAVSK